MQLLYLNCRSTGGCPAGASHGVHQWSALTPLCFIHCMDTVTAEIQQLYPWSLLYAYNVFLALENSHQLQEQMQQWNIKLTLRMDCG